MGNSTTAPDCTACQRNYSQAKIKEKICKLCKKSFCDSCCKNTILLQEDADKFVNEGKSAVASVLCLGCFKQNSTIDFDTECDIVGEQNKRTLLWLHGACSCRKMFRIHADILAKQGYRSVLIDLPAHGTSMSIPLTIDKCVEHVYNMRMKYCRADEPPVVIGGSLGGYALMEVMKRYPRKSDFSGAVVAMASQNMGEGRSKKASIGLFFIDLSIKHLSTQTMAKLFLSASKNVDKVVLAPLGTCGIFLDQPEMRAPFLKATNSIEGIKAFQGPILFMNGSKDYFDSLQLWSNSTQKPSQSIIYDSDHFFSHDRKFLQQFAEDIKKFSDRVFSGQD